jgi:hypothetical protein
VGADALLDVGMVAEQVQGEGERGRGGLVPGEQEQQHLITDLAVGEALAGVGVAGRQ